MQNIPRGLLRCPVCRGADVAVDDHGALCAAHGRGYPVTEGVPDMAPSLSVERTIAQRTMETPAVVRVYESRLWRRHPLLGLALGVRFDKEIRIILDAARLPEGGTMLDVACGSGIYTRPFARRLREGLVVGLDLSEPMLTRAVRLARRDGLDNAVFIRGNAMELPFFDESFSAVNCCGALHLFPDPGAAVREAARVLRPGGKYTVAMARTPDTALAAPVQWFMDRGVGVHPLSRRELSVLFGEAGLVDVRCHHEKAFWMILSATKPDSGEGFSCGS
ncbi:MAG: methyltransferase domain-containing protein [Desulfatibacillaceae bacterium]